MKYLISAVLVFLVCPLFGGEGAARLRTMVEKLAGQSRSPENASELHQAAAMIEKAWTDLGLTVTRQAVDTDTERFYNLIVSFGPPEGKRLVVGAHYDTVAGSVGADDNASGVAGLVELAYQLKHHNPELKQPIDLVAFVLEEMPYFQTPMMGSMVYAKSLKQAGVEVELMVTLEMIGFYSEEPGSQKYPDPTMAQMLGDKGNFIALIGRAEVESQQIREMYEAMTERGDLSVAPLPLPEALSYISRSDHAAFWANHLPAILVTDTGNFRNANYHEGSDTPDTLDYAFMQRVIDGIYAFLTR